MPTHWSFAVSTWVDQNSLLGLIDEKHLSVAVIISRWTKKCFVFCSVLAHSIQTDYSVVERNGGSYLHLLTVVKLSYHIARGQSNTAPRALRWKLTQSFQSKLRNMIWSNHIFFKCDFRWFGLRPYLAAVLSAILLRETSNDPEARFAAQDHLISSPSSSLWKMSY